MKIRPEFTVDGGTWISDDRVYAFVGTGGIGEVGYHGSQPVSRNSRIFAGANGVLGFGAPGSHLREFDWLPGSVGVQCGVGGGEAELRITASGRRLLVTGRCPGLFAVTFKLDALFTAVHGKRTWEMVERDSSSVTYRCRDTIHLDEWMEREGPYAGDFLIPEPMRRIVFRRRCRSGFATKEDLLPEYRDAHVPVYDGEFRVRIGGEGYSVTEQVGALFFTAADQSKDGVIPPFCISFDEAGVHPEARPATLAGVADLVARQERRLATAPALQVAGHEVLARFFQTVPGLVDSAVVQDLGIPRATPGRYYWIWSWDAMVTAHAGLLWGDTDLARKTGEFVDAHRDARRQDADAMDARPAASGHAGSRLTRCAPVRPGLLNIPRAPRPYGPAADLPPDDVVPGPYPLASRSPGALSQHRVLPGPPPPVPPHDGQRGGDGGGGVLHILPHP